MYYVDSSDYSHVVVCEQCHWRELVSTPAAGVKRLAIHLKKVHGDSLAARRARDAYKKRLSRSKKRPELGSSSSISP